MMTTRTWSLCSDLDGVGTAVITSRVMSVPSSAHSRRVANPPRSPRQADFADPLEGNRSVADVARNIGVHEMTLGRWVKKTRDSQQEQIPPDAELTGSERLELIRLRAELKDDKATIAELQMQVEFANKVATWFAKGKQ